MKAKYTLLSVIIFLLTIGHAALAQDKQPNIIFIMADDLGIGDISCYGATMINTPNIDKLARQGMKFENFYTAGSVCTPTRYSVLTGRYPFRAPALAADN